MLVSKSSQLYGILVLVFVNIVWVAASEITRYLFIDLGFKRPFFFTYAKSCMLSLFLLRYACTWQSKLPRKSGQVHYSRLDANHNNSSGEEDDEDAYEAASLTAAEFEPIPVTDVESTTSEFPAQMGITPATDVESIPGQFSDPQNGLILKKDIESPTGEFSSHEMNGDFCNVSLSDSTETALCAIDREGRKVRFSRFREVRRLPAKLEYAAKLARLPYRPSNIDFWNYLSCTFSKSALFNYSLYFAPLWLIGSVSYQTALAFSSVSSVNLISASSPLFVLILGVLFGRNSQDAFSFYKLVLVLLNLGGVCVVSSISDSMTGSAISLFSAFANALYLFVLSRLSLREESIDMPLMLGVVGMFSLLVCTPLMIVLHDTGIESQLPLPSLHQMGVLLFNSFLGTLFADSLWLYATLLTGSLTSSLSGSLGIPLSLLADSFFRNQPPGFWQIVSSIPIMVSFIGASLLTTTTMTTTTSSRTPATTATTTAPRSD